MRINSIVVLSFLFASPAIAAELPEPLAGKEIVVQPGEYNQQLTINTANTIYRCAVPRECVIKSDSGRDGIVSVNGDNSTIDGFTIDGGGTADIGVWLKGNGSKITNSLVENINVDDAAVGSGIETEADNAVISNNVVRNVGNDSLDHGVYVSGGNNWEVSGNDVSGASGFGIHLWHNPGSGVITNNMSHDNGLGGIVVGAGDGDYTASDIFVSDNTTFGNGANGIEENGSVSGNTFIDNKVSDGVQLINGAESGTNGLKSGVQSVPVQANNKPVVTNEPTDVSGGVQQIASNEESVQVKDGECKEGTKSQEADFRASSIVNAGLSKDDAAALDFSCRDVSKDTIIASSSTDTDNPPIADSAKQKKPPLSADSINNLIQELSALSKMLENLIAAISEFSASP